MPRAGRGKCGIGTMGECSSLDHSPLPPRSGPAGRLRELSGDCGSSRGLRATRGRTRDRNMVLPALHSNILPGKPALCPRPARPEQGPGPLRVRPQQAGALRAGDRSSAPTCQSSPFHRSTRNGSQETKTRPGRNPSLLTLGDSVTALSWLWAGHHGHNLLS